MVKAVYLSECHLNSVLFADDVRRILFLHKAQKVLLVHAGGGVDVRVDLADVVEVAVRYFSLTRRLVYVVEQRVLLVLGEKVAQTSETERLPVNLHIICADVRSTHDTRLSCGRTHAVKSVIKLDLLRKQ